MNFTEALDVVCGGVLGFCILQFAFGIYLLIRY